MPLIIPGGFYQPRGAFDPAGGGAGFTGIGDVTSGALAYYGIRAYNAAYATGSNPAIDIVDQAGANDLTVNILSTGALDVASINAWVTAHSVTTIKVKRAYDQIGTRHCVTPGAGGTLANMPTLVLSGAFPVLAFNGSQWLSAGTNLAPATQPFTLYAVGKAVGTNSVKTLLGANGPLSGLFWDGANTMALYANGAVVDFDSTGTDGTFWTFQGMINGASSKGQVGTNFTNVSGNPGAGDPGEPSISNQSFPATMEWVEGGFWSGDQSATFNAVNTNAKAYWGY
jgi:hypothetical protein